MQLRLRHLPRLVAWCGVPECASAVFLEGNANGALFTISFRPRTSVHDGRQDGDEDAMEQMRERAVLGATATSAET